MDHSNREVESFTCTCGNTFDAWTRTVLDIEYHPDVRNSSKELIGKHCTQCGKLVLSKKPLILMNPHPDIGIIVCPGRDGTAFETSFIQYLIGDPLPPPRGVVINVDRTLSQLAVILDPAMPALPQLDTAGEAISDISNDLVAVFRDQLEQRISAQKYIPPFYASRTITSLEDLETLLQNYPQASTNEFLSYLEAHRSSVAHLPDVFVKSTDLIVELFRLLATGIDIPTAWSEYRKEVKNYGKKIQSEREKVEEILEQGNNEQLRPGTPRFEIYNRAILLALVTGDQGHVAILHANRGAELLRSGGFIDDENGAAAEFDLERALELTTTPESLAIHADVSLNLGTVISRSSRGNPSENQERAITLLQQCAEYYKQVSELEKFALCITNLSIIYTDRILGDPLKNLHRARSLCLTALDIRSPHINVNDWSFTAAELARILTKVELSTTPEEHRTNLLKAIELYRDIDVELGRAGYQERRAGVLTNRAAALVDLARLDGSIEQRARAKSWIEEHTQDTADAVDEEIANQVNTLVQQANLASINPQLFGSEEPPEWALRISEDLPTDIQRETLDQAAADANMALSFGNYASTGGAVTAYKVLSDISEIRADSIEHQIKFLKSGLDASRERPVESLTHEILIAIGSKYAQLEDWTQSAEYYSQAVAAIKYFALRSLKSPTGVVDWSRYPKLIEWCAYALAKAGKLTEAVTAIENARARTLGSTMDRDEAELSYLHSVDCELAQEFRDARQRLRETKVSVGELISPNRVEVVDNFERIVSRIREIPKMKNFMGEADIAQIFEAARLFGPIAYPISTPAGTVCLVVNRENDSSSISICCVADTPVSSSRIVRCVARFDGERLSGIASSDPAGVDDGIVDSTHVLRDAFIDSLSKYLSSHNLEKVALVPAGILGMIPYSAVLTSKKKFLRRDNYRFSELFAVVIAPSATVIRHCYSRAERLHGKKLNVVAAADPERKTPGRSLRYAATEVSALRKLYCVSSNSVLTGPEATAEKLLQLAAGASHIHFAGHGHGDRIDPLASAMMCSDGPLSAGRIRESAVLDSRLVVVSTCESGKLSVGENADLNDAIGLPSELLSAGSACVIASLWEVDDLATCFLMIKFYEELRKLEQGSTVVPGAPAEALRRAQVWLQTRTSRQLGDYRLKWISDKRGTGKTKPWTDARSINTPRSPQEFTSRKPFAHPRFWAPFVAVGV